MYLNVSHIKCQQNSISRKLKAYSSLLRLDRPIGILLLLWPTYWALWVAAGGFPGNFLIIIFTLGVIIMRSAGCVINDIFDRKFDPYVQRTQHRPLGKGLVSIWEAWGLVILLSCVALALVLMLNRLTLFLSVIGLALAIIYPLLKRITHWPQMGLGLAFSWGIVLVFAARSHHVPPITWLLVIINCLWCIVYDTEYAMVDREDDITIGVKSTAILFASQDRLLIACLQAMVLILLLFMGMHLALNFCFYLACGIGLFLFIYQQHLLHSREPAACLRAFTHNHWFGMVVFVGLVLGQY